MGNYVIRRMKADEVKIAIDWAQEQGWNPGINDAACFFKADPNGFFIGLLDGEPIATGAAVTYGDDFAFCGLYIVKAEYRQHGYGLQLTEERLKHTGNRLTGLDGVLDKVDKYKRLGYVEAHPSIRFALNSPLEGVSVSKNIVPIEQVIFASLEAYDRLYFPGYRTEFLKSWITQPKAIAFGWVQDGILAGYGVARKCIKGYKIGPLFAESREIAQSLFEALAGAVEKGPVFLDCPGPNKEALALVKSYGMTYQFEEIRMYRNGNPNLNLQNIYGITTFELG